MDQLPVWLQFILLLGGGVLGGGGVTGLVGAIGGNSAAFRESLLKRVGALETLVDSLDKRNDELINKNAELGAKLQITEARLGAVNERLTVVMLENEQLHRDNKVLKERINNLERNTPEATHE